MADQGKSKRLAAARAELEELRRRADELEAQIEAAGTDGESEDHTDETRRRLVHGAWMAPVIMAVNVPDSVFAQSMVSPSPDPSPKPTVKPSQKPTPAPEPTGCCSFSDGSFQNGLTEEQCQQAGGKYLGDRTICNEV